MKAVLLLLVVNNMRRRSALRASVQGLCVAQQEREREKSCIARGGQARVRGAFMPSPDVAPGVRRLCPRLARRLVAAVSPGVEPQRGVARGVIGAASFSRIARAPTGVGWRWMATPSGAHIRRAARWCEARFSSSAKVAEGCLCLRRAGCAPKTGMIPRHVWRRTTFRPRAVRVWQGHCPWAVCATVGCRSGASRASHEVESHCTACGWPRCGHPGLELGGGRRSNFEAITTTTPPRHA